MFCGECGKEITDPNGVCSNCGNVQSLDEERFPENYNEPTVDYNNQGYYGNQPQNNYNDYNGNYNDGYNDNYANGYSDNYGNGYNDNYSNGYNDNYYNDNYYNDNYSNGRIDNYQDEFEQNYSGEYEGDYNDDYDNYNQYDYEEPKKKSGVVKPLIAALCGAAGLIAIIVVCYNVFFSGPDQVAKKWVNAVKDSDYETVYDYLPKEYKRYSSKNMLKTDIMGHFDKEEVEYNGRKDERGNGKVGDGIKADGKIYIYDVGPETIKVFKQDGDWKVAY